MSANSGLSLSEFGGQPVDGGGLRRHVALRVEIDVEGGAARNAVDQLDAAELDQAMALARIEAGGFGIEDDLAHLHFLLSFRRPREGGDQYSQDRITRCTRFRG